MAGGFYLWLRIKRGSAVAGADGESTQIHHVVYIGSGGIRCGGFGKQVNGVDVPSLQFFGAGATESDGFFRRGKPCFTVLGGEFGGGHGAVGRYPDFAERMFQGFAEFGFALFQPPCVFTFRPCGPHMEGEG